MALATIRELSGLLAELDWGLRTATAEGKHGAVIRFCEHELSQECPMTCRNFLVKPATSRVMAGKS
jgi:hypothetical protein